MGYGLDDEVSSFGRGKEEVILSLGYHAQTESGTRPTSCAMSTGAQAAGALS